MKKSITIIVFIILTSFNQTDRNKSKLIRVNQEPSQDTISSDINQTENNLVTDPYDSLANVQIDTTTLSGKRQWIINQFLIENRPSSPDYDTLFDLTYDGFKDYVIGYYGQSGTGIKNRVKIYFYNPKTNCYILNEQLSDLPNPTFYIKQKKITGFYIGNGGGSGRRLEWINKKWTTTKEFDVDYEGDSTEWKINYPLKKKTEIKIKPYQMIPPQNILETDIKW